MHGLHGACAEQVHMPRKASHDTRTGSYLRACARARARGRSCSHSEGPGPEGEGRGAGAVA